MSSQYLNTDLCLSSGADLSALAAALAGRVEQLFCGAQPDGKWYASFCAPGSGSDDRSPQQDIALLLAAIESLEGTAAGMLSDCESRELNVGWQAAKDRPEGAFWLDPRILAELAIHEIVLGVTIYPSSENDFEAEPSS